MVFRYHGCGGICLGITVVRLGNSSLGLLCPTNAPRITSGKCNNIHIHNNAIMVPKGRADEDREAMRKKLRPIIAANARPGMKSAVYTVSTGSDCETITNNAFLIHPSLPNCLYSRALR